MTPDPTHPAPEDLFAYRDGEVSAEKRALLEAHVSSCRVCRELIDRISGLEAALRQRPDRVEGDYYAALSRSVLQKIGAKAPEAGAAMEAGAPAELRPGKPARAAGAEAPPRERRRGEEPEEPGLSRAPGLPWGALISTMAAAAAVVVVVVMLFRQGAVRSPYLANAPKEGAPEAGAPAESSAASEAGRVLARAPEAEPKRREPAPPTAPPAARPAPAPAPAGEEVALGSGVETAPQAAADRAVALKAAPRANEVQPRERLEAAREKKDEAAAPAAGMVQPPAMQKLSGEEASPGAPYTSVTRRFGLPEVWTEGSVPRERLLKAERDFRYLYMSGAAGADSARVRLYLAEAARLRYESAPDSTLYETIIHHYWRAIRLAGDQPDVARIARQRLESFTR